MFTRVTLILTIVVACSAGCRKQESAPQNAAASASSQTPAGATAAPAADPAAKSGSGIPPAAAIPTRLPALPVPATLPNVLARVNNEDVKKVDFDRLVKNIEIQNHGPVPPDRRDEILRQVLDELVTYTVLKQEAKARKIAVTDDEVEQQLNLMRQQAKTEANFKKALAARNMSLEQLKADTRVELAISRMMHDLVANAPAPTDADAKQFYDANPERFKREEMVRASHILILVDPNASAEVKQQARMKIDELHKRVKSGEDFAAVARAHSQDGSAAQGGDLNFFPREKMVKPFADAAFALKPGEISDVVTSQFGFHIIKTTDRKPAGTVPLEEVSTQVKNYLAEKKKQDQAQSFIAALKQKSKIEVLI